MFVTYDVESNKILSTHQALTRKKQNKNKTKEKRLIKL